MLQAAREAREFAADLTFEAFERNRMAQLAILKAVEMVGEAASRVSPEGKGAHAEIPLDRNCRHAESSCAWVFQRQLAARLGDRAGRHPASDFSA